MLLIKKVQEVEIFVTNDGKFTATIDERNVVRTSVSAIEKLIFMRNEAVKLWNVYPWAFKKQKEILNIVAIEKGRALGVEGKRYGRYDLHLYNLTPKQEAEIDRMIAQQEKLDMDWEKYISKLKEINADEFQKLLVKKGDQ